MSAHVSRICSAAYYHLRDIDRIRPFLTVETTERLVHAFVTSRLDMGNALFYGITRGQLQRLQRVQNSAARHVTRIDRRHHIKPVLQQLHWLPVEQRIHYKLLLQVYRALNGLVPAYIAELLQETRPMQGATLGLAESFGCTTITHHVGRQELPRSRSPALELSAS